MSYAIFLSLLGDFRFYVGSDGRFFIFILWNFWKLPNGIFYYDTNIIFFKHLGAMLFALNTSKNINIFLSAKA